MSMPGDLVLVRHGQSEGNIVVENAKVGELSGYTDAFVTTPGHQWRLTALGQAQAAAIGGWLAGAFPPVESRPGFDNWFVSPYVRTRETAALLGLPEAAWVMNRALRERDWGDIGSMPRTTFVERYPDNAAMKEIDPLYWVPPGGESIANVAEDRVRNVLSTLHRECSDRRVLAVTHGELMWSMRLVLERWDDEEFLRRDVDNTERITNCMALHYTRTDPVTGDHADRLTHLRRAHPVCADGTWSVEVSPWITFGKPVRTNADLLASIADVPSIF